MINVVKPYLPNRHIFNRYIDRIYQSNILTNNGPLVEELTNRLEEYLKVKNLLLVSNGTVALDLGIDLLGYKQEQEIFTTPFTFVATSSTIEWKRCKVNYGDVDLDSFNLSSSSLANSSKANILLPVHVFGNPCSKLIDQFCEKENKNLLFDAAHAFGVEEDGQSVLLRGDISTLSFHATKLFHTGEGGALIIKSDDLYQEAKSKINFGFKDGAIQYTGMNFKMSEYHAAIGLSVLDEMHLIREQREEVYSNYVDSLKDSLQLQKIKSSIKPNYSYFPVVFESENQLLKTFSSLNSNGVNPRRYFYPSLNTLTNNKSCPSSEYLSERILCLPIYPGLSKKDQELIINTVRKSFDE